MSISGHSKMLLQWMICLRLVSLDAALSLLEINDQTEDIFNNNFRLKSILQEKGIY